MEIGERETNRNKTLDGCTGGGAKDHLSGLFINYHLAFTLIFHQTNLSFLSHLPLNISNESFNFWISGYEDFEGDYKVNEKRFLGKFISEESRSSSNMGNEAESWLETPNPNVRRRTQDFLTWFYSSTGSNMFNKLNLWKYSKFAWAVNSEPNVMKIKLY